MENLKRSKATHNCKAIGARSIEDSGGTRISASERHKTEKRRLENPKDK